MKTPWKKNERSLIDVYLGCSEIPLEDRFLTLAIHFATRKQDAGPSFLLAEAVSAYPRTVGKERHERQAKKTRRGRKARA